MDTPLEAIPLDPGDRQFKNYKELMLYCFEEALKTIPDDVRDWPEDTTTRMAAVRNIPGNLGGMILEISLTRAHQVIPDTEYKA